MAMPKLRQWSLLFRIRSRICFGHTAPGETSNYTAFYIIDQMVMDNGGLVNVATASNGTVSDTSNTVTTTVVASPSLEVTKIASINTDDGDGLIGADDIIKYTISIRNTGNLTLTNLTFTDVMTGKWRGTKFNYSTCV